MAIGDAAAAQGLPVEPSTSDIRLGFEAINRLADATAGQMVADDARFDALEAPGTWVEVRSSSSGSVNPPSYSAKWVPYAAGGWAGVAYRVKPGLLFLQSVAQSNAAWAAGETIFTLPTGLRPTRRQVFYATQAGAGPNSGVTEMVVETTGQVKCNRPGAQGQTLNFGGVVVIN